MSIFNAPKDCIRTNSGLYINVFEPTEDMICIEDIAHALSSLPRFGGHINKHYSVAQHSVMCYERAIGIEDKKSALMHDASEAYMLDIPTPIKAKLPDYKMYEANLMSFIAKKYGFVFPLNEAVHSIDREMLILEWENLVANQNENFECWCPTYAKERFLKAFNEIFK